MKARRITFEFQPRALERLDALKTETEAASYAEVVKNALRLYETLIEEDKAGTQFLKRDATGVVSPFKVFI